MKKISLKRKLFLDKRARKLVKKKKKRIPLLKKKTAFFDYMPEILDLEDPKYYNDTITFFHLIRKKANTDEKLRLSFKKLIKITPSAALVLAAEIDRYKMNHHCKLRIIQQKKWKAHIKQQFSELGLFKLLGIKNISKKYKEIDTCFIPFFSGTIVVGNEVVEFCRKINDLIQQGEFGTKIITAIIEAMTNVFDHAYEKDTDDNHVMPPYWWIFASYNIAVSELTITFYDQGMGISKTLDPTKVERLKSLLKLKSANDALLIKYAATKYRSRTKKNYRGKGFSQIINFTEKNEDGSVRIISNHGEFKYNQKSNSEYEHKFQLQGTLLEWKINIRGKHEKNN